MAQHVHGKFAPHRNTSEGHTMNNIDSQDTEVLPGYVLDSKHAGYVRDEAFFPQRIIIGERSLGQHHHRN